MPVPVHMCVHARACVFVCMFVGLLYSFELEYEQTQDFLKAVTLWATPFIYVSSSTYMTGRENPYK